jgi:DNA-binding response OmpR family regulator
MVFGIVQQHQGWIECSSEVNRGTAFTIHLPRSSSGPAPVSSAASLPAPTGSEMILLVEDEPMLRDLGRAILERHGYKVLVASDGREGVELFRREKDHIDLVILDWTTPRLSGRDALQQLLQINPHVQVLLVSGYAPGVLGEAGLERVLGFIQKPYREQDLTHTVRLLLDRATP